MGRTGNVTARIGCPDLGVAAGHSDTDSRRERGFSNRRTPIFLPLQCESQRTLLDRNPSTQRASL
jgi:hypothetical protein